MTRQSLHLPLCIDSGAFSAYQQKDEIDLGQWIAFCKEVGGRYAGTTYVNLDVIAKGRGDDNASRQSYHNWIAMRRAGLDPLPVYHVNSDPKWLLKYLRKTDRIGLGAMAKMPDRKRILVLDRLWRQHLMTPDGKPKVKVHGMGLTSFALVARYPWHSFDSTTWMMQASYGRVYIPPFKGRRWAFDVKPLSIVMSADNPSTRDRGKHYLTMTPLRQQLIRQFLKDVAHVALGRSDRSDTKHRGVLNDYYARCCLNAYVVARYVRAVRPEATLFLSGKIPIENFIRTTPSDFDLDKTGIMLSFYSINRSENTICSKRLRAFEADRPVEFMKTRKKRKP